MHSLRKQTSRLFGGRKRGLAVLMASLFGVGIGAVLLASPAKAAEREKKPEPEPGPPSARRARVEAYLAELERVTGIEGIATFGLAAARRESGFNPNADNTSASEAAAACRGWKGGLKRGFWKENPWRDDPVAWCWGSGGWYGFLPSTMLGRSAFEELDPALAPFDPGLSTAAFGAFCASIIRNTLPDLPPHQRNWASVRMAMAALVVAKEQSGTSKETAGKVRERLKQNLVENGDPASFADAQPSATRYPGNAAVLAAMIEFAAKEGP